MGKAELAMVLVILLIATGALTGCAPAKKAAPISAAKTTSPTKPQDYPTGEVVWSDAEIDQVLTGCQEPDPADRELASYCHCMVDASARDTDLAAYLADQERVLAEMESNGITNYCNDQAFAGNLFAKPRGSGASVTEETNG